jgi:signal transduction histidine kinase
MYRGEKMTIIVDKLILFFICSFSILFLPINLNAVINVLIAVSISSLCYYFHSAKATSVLLVLYFVLCMANPMFCIFLPLLIYDIAYFNLKYLALFALLFLISFWFGIDFIQITISLLGVGMSVVMQDRTKRYAKLQKEYKRLRDTSQELNMYLSNKNRMLIENQNYEIHLATLQERNRIAREIHDNVGHMLSRSLLQVGAIMAICKEELLSDNLLSLKDTLNDAMNSIRESVHGLHENSIDLQANINGIIDKFQDYSIHLDYDMSDTVSKDIKYCFIMIIKEALSNTSKHSNADCIEIIVREHPVFYQLLIKDNGTNSSKKDTGMGLENMRTRVLTLSGNISIDSKEGFKIFISIPKNSMLQEGE